MKLQAVDEPQITALLKPAVIKTNKTKGDTENATFVYCRIR